MKVLGSTKTTIKLLIVAIIVLITNFSISYSKEYTGNISASGSTALLPLAQEAANMFMAENPKATITINGGGSGLGLVQVANGTVDIGNSDVEASTKLTKDQAASLVEHKVAISVIAIIVNSYVKDKLKTLTEDQLADIFSGKIKNWKEVGGPDGNIVVIIRPTTSGTRALFTQFALKGKEELSPKAIQIDDSISVLKNVSDNRMSIGYTEISYLKKRKNVVSMAINGVEPSLDTVYAGKYNIWGYSRMYTKKNNKKELVDAFVAYFESPEFIAKMESIGYGAPSKIKSKR